MASKPKPAERASWEVDFVHLELSTHDKETLKTWDTKGTATLECLSSLCVDGWKLSVNFDSKNDCAIASLTSPKAAQGGHKVCLSARGPDFFSSLRSLVYKCAIILQGDMSLLEATAESRSQWG